LHTRLLFVYLVRWVNKRKRAVDVFVRTPQSTVREYCLCIISDIDECRTGEHSCQQLCNNLPGTYNCSCDTGFTLNNDSRTCNGRNVRCLIHFDSGFKNLLQITMTCCISRTQRITHSHNIKTPKFKVGAKYAMEDKMAIVSENRTRCPQRLLILACILAVRHLTLTLLLELLQKQSYNHRVLYSGIRIKEQLNQR